MKFNNYNVIELINSGAFSNVYKCEYDNKIYAIKEDSNYKLLKYEAEIYKQLLAVKNISDIYDFFTLDNKYYLVLENYEITLKDYKYRFFNSHDYNIRVSRIISILIDTLNDIHNKNIIHRDLKPTNICFDSNYNPYIIDFGLAKKYYNNGYHILEGKINNIIGSPNFVSKNVINLITPSRRDDMESIIFIFIYIILDNDAYLKYNNLKMEYKKDLIYINNILINTCYVNNIFNSMLYIRRLKFTQMPNYTLIKKMLLN